jgi:hypothetical protein
MLGSVLPEEADSGHEKVPEPSRLKLGQYGTLHKIIGDDPEEGKEFLRNCRDALKEVYVPSPYDVDDLIDSSLEFFFLGKLPKTKGFKFPKTKEALIDLIRKRAGTTIQSLGRARRRRGPEPLPLDVEIYSAESKTPLSMMSLRDHQLRLLDCLESTILARLGALALTRHGEALEIDQIELF